MPTEMQSKYIYAVIGVLLIAVIAVGIWYWSGKKTAPESLVPEKSVEEKPVDATQKAIESAGRATLPEVKSIKNPLGNKLPEVNPVEKANPFKDIYKNPF